MIQKYLIRILSEVFLYGLVYLMIINFYKDGWGYLIMYMLGVYMTYILGFINSNVERFLKND